MSAALLPASRLPHFARQLGLAAAFAAAAGVAGAEDGVQCSADGTPPIRTVSPVTERPFCLDGELLQFEQQGVTRYACLNLPKQARQADAGNRRWPLLVYLHGSKATPDSLYLEGRHLFELRNQYPLSGDPAVPGFIILSPEGRRAEMWPMDGPHTGTGFHWDEWYRNAQQNLDALAIDHFLDQAIASGRVDTRRVYVFGWSNGAYMAALYGNWRSERIAAIGQYAGADPWARSPCPVPIASRRQVPLALLRNLCDALVTCPTTSDWIAALRQRGWPFQATSLNLLGERAAPGSGCVADCSKLRGVFEHVRWPAQHVLADDLLGWLRQYTLP